MKKLILVFAALIVLSSSSYGFDFANDLIHQDSIPSDRIEELDQYWIALAKTAKEGDFNGMKSLYHEDAVLVKPDTTIAVSEAFKYRWKKEIMEVYHGKRANTLDFRFSKRVGNEITAYEKGIYHYTSVDTSDGSLLGDAYIHFETLLVKVKDRWVATMEYQVKEATIEEWDDLK